MPARIAMTAITTRSSISVKAWRAECFIRLNLEGKIGVVGQKATRAARLFGSPNAALVGCAVFCGNVPKVTFADDFRMFLGKFLSQFFENLRLRGG